MQVLLRERDFFLQKVEGGVSCGLVPAIMLGRLTTQPQLRSKLPRETWALIEVARVSFARASCGEAGTDVLHELHHVSMDNAPPQRFNMDEPQTIYFALIGAQLGVVHCRPTHACAYTYIHGTGYLKAVWPELCGATKWH